MIISGDDGEAEELSVTETPRKDEIDHHSQPGSLLHSELKYSISDSGVVRSTYNYYAHFIRRAIIYVLQ